MRSISPNVTIAADPRLLFPVSLPGSSTDTPNNRVSHNVVNSLKQRLVTSSLARDSLRIRNTQLRKYSLSKQQKLEKEVKDLKLSHNELVSKLNESQHQNDILGHQHAQMEQTLHLKISELEDSCLRQKILRQKFVSTLLARDSLRVNYNLLKMSSIRKQHKHHQELDDLNRSHHELVAELNQSKLENKLLCHQHAQMERDSHVKISQLEENCLQLTKKKEDLAVKLIQAESDVKSISSSLENHKETVCQLENVISDLQSKKKRVPNVGFSQGTQTNKPTILPHSLTKIYDRAFLMQRKSFGIKTPGCLPSEIVRKVTMGMSSSKITESLPPRRQIKLPDTKLSERVVDTSKVWQPRRETPVAVTFCHQQQTCFSARYVVF
jgi:chromosome segregation ATPase